MIAYTKEVVQSLSPSMIERRLKELDSEKSTLLGAMEERRARQRFTCACCSKMHAIKDCTVIQTYWYTSPSGCTGGDYWNAGELQIICPTTDLKNRVLFDSYYKVDYTDRSHYEYSAEMQFKSLYQHLFKSQIESYDGQRGSEDLRRWVNLNYFDENRKRFGLHVKGLDK